MARPFYSLSQTVKSELALRTNQPPVLLVVHQRTLGTISQCSACNDADRLALQGAPSGL